MSHRIRATALVPLIALVLIGCTPNAESTSDDPVTAQTVAEACEIALEDIAKASEQMTEAMAQFLTDPAAAEQTFADIAAAMHTSADGLDNAEVKAAVETAAVALEESAVIIGDAMADPANADQQELADASSDLQARFDDLAALCQ